MVYLNNIVIELRLIELKYYLNEINYDRNYNYLDIISKYKIYKDLYEKKINEEQLNYQELKIIFLLDELEKKKEYKTNNLNWLHNISIILINGIRKLSGNELYNYKNPAITNQFLVAGFYFERKKIFDKALQNYNKAINSKNLKEEQAPVVILHEGFCNAIIGNYENAKQKYISVINDYTNEEASLTAVILLKYIEGFSKEIDMIKKSEDRSDVKAEKLFKLLAYKEVLEILNTINSKDIDINKNTYLKSRCYEELGDQKNAVINYQELILSDYKSDYSKYANSRILIIASNNKNEKLKDLAVKNNILIDDPEFKKLIELSNKIDYQKELTQNKEPEIEIKDEEFEKILNNYYLNVLEFIKKQNIKESKNMHNKDKYEEKFETNNEEKSYSIKYELKDGKIYKAEVYDNNNNLLHYLIYEYDEKGNIVDIKSYDKEGNLIKK